MAQLAFIVAYLAMAGAIASWVVGAWFYARTLRALDARTAPAARSARLMWWLAIAAWPFAIGRLKGAAAAHAANVNKSLVAFFACLIVAAAALSAATNLARVSR